MARRSASEATGLDVRASDADRERVVAELREHCAEGRLTADELSDRLDAAYSARTLAELAAVSRDLPALTPPPPDAQQLLARAVTRQVLRGWRIESQWQSHAVLARGRRPNHVLHAILTVFTGIWCVVWLAVALSAREQRMLLRVEDDGTVTAQSLS